MRRRLATAMALAIAGSAVIGAAEDPGAIGRRARAYEAFVEAQNLMLDRRLEEAADRLQEAAAGDPDPALLLEAAGLERALGQDARAGQLLEQALLARPGWAPALLERAQLRLARARDAADPRPDLEAALADLRAAVSADPASVDAVQALADLCSGLGEVPEAIAALEGLKSRRPLPLDSAILLARLDLEAGRDEAARTILVELLQRAPNRLEAIDLLASLYESEQRYDEAIALYRPLIDDGVGDGAIEERVALLQLGAGRPEAAVAALREAERLDPSDHRIQLLLSQAYDAMGDVEAARAACEQFLLVEPESADGLFERARLMRRQGDGVAARRAFEDLIRRTDRRGDGHDRNATTVTLAWAQVGVLAASARDWNGAAEALTHAMERAREPQADLLRLLTRAHLERGALEEAERIAGEALARQPQGYEFAAMLGEARLLRGDEAGAEARFRGILASSSHAIEAYLSVIDACLRRQRYASAEELAREGLRRHPGDDRLLFSRGAALERLGRLGEAERSLGRAVVANPNNAMALNYLGYMLADHGRRLPDSVLYVERAVALDPENPAYLDSLGWALYKLARYAPAEKMLRAAMRYDSFDPAIREHLGDLLVATGRPTEAVREWQAALEYGHEEPNRIRAKVERVRHGRDLQP